MTGLNVLGAGALILWVITFALAVRYKDPTITGRAGLMAFAWSVTLSVAAMLS